MTIVVRSKEHKLEYYAINAEVIGIAGWLTPISEERAYKIMRGEAYTLQIETYERVPILNIVGIAKGTIQVSLGGEIKGKLWCILSEDKETYKITMHVSNINYSGTCTPVCKNVMQLMALEFIAVKGDVSSYQFGYETNGKGSYRKLTAVATGRRGNGKKCGEAHKDECKNYSGKKLIEKLCSDLLEGNALILRNTNTPYGYQRIGAEEVSRRMREEAIKCGYTE